PRAARHPPVGDQAPGRTPQVRPPPTGGPSGCSGNAGGPDLAHAFAAADRAASRPPGRGPQRAAPAQNRAPRTSRGPPPPPAQERAPRMIALRAIALRAIALRANLLSV